MILNLAGTVKRNLSRLLTPSFEPPDVDMSGKQCIVTGANSGIGKEITRNLAGMGASVVMACRSQERGTEALQEIKADTSNKNLEVLTVDLSSQSSIRDFAKTFKDQYDRLDVLVNNAGIYPAERNESVDGIEMTWATNVLGYFLLTNELEDTLIDSEPSRIVDVASKMAGKLDFDDLEFEKREFKGRDVYSQSKQANRMLAWVRAERLRETGVTVNVAHPGGVSTNIARYQKGLFGLVVRTIFGLFGKSPEQGADTPTWLAVSPELESVTGKFWANRSECDRKFDEMAQNKKLRDICESMVD